MENLDDILPYLKLREEEIILFAKRFEGFNLQIKRLAKYHEPETFPEHLITIKKDWYTYDRIDIITNFRIIKFGLNQDYMEEDRVTPISEIFHHENLFLWVNLEDIIDYKIHLDFMGSVMGFQFFGKGRLKVKNNPLNFRGYNYEEYCQIKDLVVKLLKFEQQEIDKEEDKEIQKIMGRNKTVFEFMFIGLLFLGLKIWDFIIPIDIQDPTITFFQYSLGGLYVFYMLFFVLFNIIHIGIHRKKYNSKCFFTLLKIEFAWYQGPAISVVIFVLGFMTLILELGLLSFIDNELLALSIAVGFWTFTTILVFVIVHIFQKRKKKKKTTDKVV